jgi:hypothetical protein
MVDIGKRVKIRSISAFTPNTPTLHHSNTPTLHHSNTPSLQDVKAQEL